MPDLAYGISNRRVRLAEICSGLADRLFRAALDYLRQGVFQTRISVPLTLIPTAS
jgi:hypothetical protein